MRRGGEVLGQGDGFNAVGFGDIPSGALAITCSRFSGGARWMRRASTGATPTRSGRSRSRAARRPRGSCINPHPHGEETGARDGGAGDAGKHQRDGGPVEGREGAERGGGGRLKGPPE